MLKSKTFLFLMGDFVGRYLNVETDFLANLERLSWNTSFDVIYAG